MKKLYLLSGKKSSGKDTAAKNICSQHKNSEHLSLAEPLKQAAKSFLKIVYGCVITHEHMYGNLKEEPLYDRNGNPVLVKAISGEFLVQGTFRHFAQTLGTEYGRNVLNIQIWTNAIFSRILASNSDVFAISDCRFLSEIEFFQEQCKKYNIDLKIIRINRDTGNIDHHPSENDLDDYPFEIVINNNGTKEEFYKELEFI